MLASWLHADSIRAQGFGEAAVRDVEKRMRLRYGAPHQALRDMVAGRRPNVFVWRFGERSLTPRVGTLSGSALAFTHVPLARKADAYSDAPCRSIRACGGG